jgi:hypothetical protein
VLVAAILVGGCGIQGDLRRPGPDTGQFDTGADADTDTDTDTDTDAPEVDDCGFTYDQEFSARKRTPTLPLPPIPPTGDGGIVHAEPPPPFTFRLDRGAGYRSGLEMPGYSDNLPLFERAVAWEEPYRCYELPTGAEMLTESEAWGLWHDIAKLTTGIQPDSSPGARFVVGLRGAYPGTFAWHGNTPDRFNDTLALLWTDNDGTRHVREFPVNVDVGAVDHGWENSSSLRPNRRYRYADGWHGTYNALAIVESDYLVRDDTNNNGHWDSDRNGWLPPLGVDDYDRTGYGHNIHAASVDAPLGSAAVNVWSGGCQTIPGMANWAEFITNAWVEMDHPVEYSLVDARDIAPEVWAPCTPDGTHECPWHIGALPFEHYDDTSIAPSDDFDVYNCSGADESGPEVVYVLTLDRSGKLHVEVDCDDPVVDVDVYLLDGDDPDACLDRAHWGLAHDIGPGRYFVIVDTYVDDYTVLDGEYRLDVWLE